MHPVNKLLASFGVGVHRIKRLPDEFVQNYEANLSALQAANSGFQVIREMACDIGEHPASYKEYECGFASTCLSEHKPRKVLDVGSYRDFVLGVAAAHDVTTFDVRPGPKICANETVIAGDARGLSFADGEFDAVISLSSIEHFGLGRYGDAFDLQGDRKGLKEMARVLKPGGVLIFSTTLTTGRPCLVFNLHRIYNRDMLHAFCRPLVCRREAFFSHRYGSFCELSEVSSKPGLWDVYCGCWQKPQRNPTHE
jgi:SAM-dependent methyltransferase